MTTEEKVARIENQIATIDKSVSELWSQFNAHKTYSETQFRYIIDTVSNQYKQHIEKSEQRIKDYVELKMRANASELAKEISKEMEGRAWNVWKVIQAAFQVGMLIGVFYMGVQMSQADAPAPQVQRP